MSKVFLDTNVLVYGVDAADPAKRDVARRLLRDLAKERVAGVISTQVLQEYYVTVTRKLGVAPVEARDMMTSMPALELVTVDTQLIYSAIDCSVLNRIGFWDALIVVSAQKANCDVLWTEDLSDGQVVCGVRIENPFKDASSARRGLVKERSELYRTRGRKRKQA